MEWTVCNFVNLFLSTMSCVFEYIFSNTYSTILFFFLIGLLVTMHVFIGKQLFESILGGCESNSRSGVLDFNYGLDKGPHTWKNKYPAANGYCQSPINIRTSNINVLRLSEKLMWNHYDEMPTSVYLENNGLKIILGATFACNKPTISGAELLESYSFVSLCFRWSFLDGEGSEHSIDDVKFPVEMQATHLSRDAKDINQDLFGDIGILVMSYMFSITKNDNPYLDPITSNLHLVRKPFNRVEIPPFPISWLCYPFKTGFYSYGGSLTEPPCTEGVTWFIHAEPLAISIKQLVEFRTILDKNGKSRILKNFRPVQKINSREVVYNQYDPLHRISDDSLNESYGINESDN